MKNSPKGLSAEARRLWGSITAAYSIEDEAGMLLLQTAMESFDRMRQAQAVIKAEGITTKDRFGQARQHPATLVERDAKNMLMKALGALHLDLAPSDAVGAPVARL
jgi:P27 family predicted phage terminase small subunit